MKKCTPKEMTMLGAIFFLALLLRIIGIGWGLPDQEKAGFFYKEVPQGAESNLEIGEAIHSYHADEPKIIKAISNMNPAELDFNPHQFIYPACYIYMVAAAIKTAGVLKMVEIAPSKKYYFSHPEIMGKFYLIGRLITLLLGLFTVLLTYLIGKQLYNKWVGLLAALILSLLPLHVVHSKYMSVDVPTAFWIALSVYFATKIDESKKMKWYLLAGLTAGLATATKYYAGLVAVSFIAAHYVNSSAYLEKKRLLKSFVDKRVTLGCLMVIVGFFIGSPYVFLAPMEFYHGAILHHFHSIVGGVENYDMVYGGYKWSFFFHVYASMVIGMGIFLCASSITGVVHGAMKRKKSDWILFSFMLPYYLMIGISFLRPMRYAIPLLPFFALLSARLFYDLFQSFEKHSLRRALQTGLVSLVGGVLLFTFLNSLSYGLIMRGKDNRDLAAQWIVENVEKGSSVGFVMDPGFFSVPLNPEAYRLKIIGLDREKFEKESPDVFVMTEFDYGEFLRLRDKYPVQAGFIAELISGKFRYGNSKYDTIWFESSPKVLGWDFGPESAPHDWLYPFPKVVILKKKSDYSG